MQNNIKFNSYVNDFKKLELSEKKQILMEQLKILASVTNGMCKTLGSENEILYNRELIDIKNENFSEDDYVEALLVLVNSIQRSITDFNFKISDLFDQIVEKKEF